MDLLPDDISEFRSEFYWTDFFRKRGSLPFEWYGEWSELEQLVDRVCSTDDSILMVGCGNSELSASMYDSGYLDLTNIDFSKPVIAEMMKKNLRQRPKMRWKVMDMTAMTFEKESFNVVIDKGGLDALMGEPGQEGEVAGAELLHEVKRVLKADNGRYLCVTLAQDYVADLLMKSFRHGWDVALHRMPQPKDGPPSALQPFVFVATRSPSSESRGEKVSLVTMAFDRISSGSMDAAQIQVLCQGIEAENEYRQSANADLSDSVGVGWREVVEGRREECQLAGSGESARYSATVLDAKAEGGALEHECAVFLVPQGREHEWMFAAEEGQWQLMDSAKAKRLIVVRMNRGHHFGTMESVQTELSPLVLKLAPQHCRDGGTLIPYMTTGDGLGCRTSVEVVHSPLTGRMEIEDVQFKSDENGNENGIKNGNENDTPPPTWRRLFFSRSIGLVQSESLLFYLQTGRGGGWGEGTKKPRKKGGKREKERQAARAAVEEEGESSLGKGVRIEYSHLACGYHIGMVAGLALIQPHMARRVGEGREVVELDPVVGEVAQRHFGFRTTHRLKLTIGDGISAVESMSGDQSQGVADDTKKKGENEEELKKEEGERRGIQVLIIDADSDDTTTGMSCPPAAFLEPSFLKSASSVLLSEGMVVVNVVSRAQEPYDSAVAALQSVFAEVYEMDVDEDVNRLLFALPSKCSIDTSEGGLLEAAKNLDSLARQHGPWRRGPNLEEYTCRVKLLPR